MSIKTTLVDLRTALEKQDTPRVKRFILRDVYETETGRSAYKDMSQCELTDDYTRWLEEQIINK